MDTLFDAIKEYLAYHNARLRPDRVGVPWQTPATDRHPWPLACRICGRAITSGEGRVPLAHLWAARSCAAHYRPALGAGEHHG